MYILGSNIAWRGMGRLLRNSAIFKVPSYFLGTDDDGTSGSLCTYAKGLQSSEIFKKFQFCDRLYMWRLQT